MVGQQNVPGNASQAYANIEYKAGLLDTKINTINEQITYSQTYYNGNVTSTTTNSTDNTIVRYDGTDGKNVQGSGPVIDDLSNIKGAASIGNTAGIAFGSGTNGALTLTSTMYNNPIFNGKFLQINGAGVISPADAVFSNLSNITIGTTSQFDVNVISNNKNILIGRTNGAVSEVILGDVNDVNVIYLNGGVEYNYKLMTGGGAYTITDDDYFVKFTGTVAFNIQLLTAAASGRTIMLRNNTNQNMIVIPIVGQSIGGSNSNFIVPSGATIKLMADGGVDWILI